MLVVYMYVQLYFYCSEKVYKMYPDLWRPQFSTSNHTEKMEYTILTEPEEEVIIRKYINIEKKIKPKSDCAIGVGYTTCIDIGF